MRNDELGAVFSVCGGFHVRVGFSGGADSSAALLLARDAAERVGFRLTAVHFHHHLRGAAADADADAAADLARKLGVEFQLYDLYPAPGPGVEARARELRLAKWRELAGGRRDAAVVLGHHRDDRVENLLLRLTRGANASGLTGMRPDTVVAGVRFLRPLWRLTRAEVEAFLRSRGVTRWAEDATNADPECAFRNRLRQRVLPELYAASPGARSGLAAALDALELDAEFLETEAARRLAAGDPAEAAFWRELPPALVGRCLRTFLLDRGETRWLPHRAGVARLTDAVRRGRDAAVPLGDAVTLRLSAGRLYVEAPPPPDVAWRWRETPELRWGDWVFTAGSAAGPVANLPPDTVAFAPDELPDALFVGSVREGETMTVFGGSRRVKLKKLRIDRKVPAYPPPPVLRTPDGEALWMPLVRRSGRFPVTSPGAQVRFFAKKSE